METSFAGLLVIILFTVSFSSSFELTLEPDELVKVQRESHGKFYFQETNAALLMLNRSIFVFRDDVYDSWSDWSACSTYTCLEHRYRRCKDESYKDRVDYPTADKRVCLFKYLTEVRPCQDRSACIENASPSEELQRMQSICGQRREENDTADDAKDQKKKDRRRGGSRRYEPEYEDEDDYYTSRRRPRPRYTEMKILGGKSAKSLAWPWQVALYKAGNYNATEGLTRLRSENVVCGGTLIAPQWVLTAAHCMKPFVGTSTASMQQGVPIDLLGPALRPHSMLIRAGDTLLEGTRDRNEQESDHVVDTAIIHPNWTAFGRAQNQYDLALLHLQTPVEIGGDGAGVACLPREEGDGGMPSEDALCYTVGWGDTYSPYDDESDDSRRYHHNQGFWNWFTFWPFGRREAKASRGDALKEIKVSIESPEKCLPRRYQDEGEEEVTDGQICAGNPSKGICSGDTGGGLICKNEADGKWYLYGVAGTLSKGVCQRRRWSYSAVENVLKWINSHVN